TFTNIQVRGERNKLALAADSNTVIVASGNTLHWLDVENLRVKQSRIVAEKRIIRLGASPGEPGLIAYSADQIHVLSPAGEALLRDGPGPDPETGPKDEYAGAFALSWNGRLLAVSGTNNFANDCGTVRLFDAKTGKRIGKDCNLGVREAIGSLAFSPNGRFL